MVQGKLGETGSGDLWGAGLRENAVGDERLAFAACSVVLELSDTTGME